MKVVAGVDSSTQSTTVVLRDAATGRIVGSGRSPHPTTTPPVSEQDPHTWWDALVLAMHQAREAAGVDEDDIVAIAVAAQCHGLVALDADGDVIRPAKLWNDTTSSAEVAELTARIGAEKWIKRVGSLPTAAFTVSKVLWLARHEPASFARMRTVLLPHDWLTHRLTGRFVTDRSEATGTGYYDARAGEYALEVLALIDPERDWAAQLPEVLGPSDPAGRVLPAVSAELGISPDAIVGAGAGDQHAGAVGLGVRPGDTVFSLGTSGVVYSVSSEPVTDLSGIVNCVADAAGGFQPLVCTLNAAKVTDAVARLLGVDHTELSRLAAAAPRTADRPVFAAYLDGERTPNLPDARGVLSGFGSDLTREQLALAAYEGVVFGLVRGLEVITGQGVSQDGKVIAVGGGAHSPAYLQAIADITGRPVETADGVEIVAAGAAVQAAAVLRGVPITEQRDAWAPRTQLAATPRVDPTLGSVRARYTTTAAWRGADTAPASDS
jgi:xylulokinase